MPFLRQRSSRERIIAYLPWVAMAAVGAGISSLLLVRQGQFAPRLSAEKLRFRTTSAARPLSNMSSSSASPPPSAAIWLHGLGDNGPNNAPIQYSFSGPEFQNMKWHFPSAPYQPVTCNYGAVMPAWFDIAEIPITAESPPDEAGLLKAVQKVHEMLDKEIESGISAERIFLCGFSQGGALTLASVLLYPKRLAGAAVFSGFVAFTKKSLEKATEEGKKTPLLWQHGMDDPVVNFEAGKKAPTLLAGYGINCEFKAYPGLGHSISPAELACLKEWMKTRLATFVL